MSATAVQIEDYLSLGAKVSTADSAVVKKKFEAGGRLEAAGHTASITSVEYNLSGDLIGTSSVDGTARVWSISESRIKEVKKTSHSGVVAEFRWSPIDPNVYATVSYDKSLQIHDTRTDKSIAVVPTRSELIKVTWSPDGSALAVGSKRDDVTFINAADGYVAGKPWNFKKEVNDMAWSHDNSHFIFSTGSGQLRVLTYPECRYVIPVEAHTAQCYCFRFSPERRYIASGGADCVVRLWDTDNLVCLRSFATLDAPIRTLGFNFDSKLLAYASSERNCIHIGHVESGDCLTQVSTDAGVSSVSWHPTKNLLAFGGAGRERSATKEKGVFLTVIGGDHRSAPLSRPRPQATRPLSAVARPYRGNSRSYSSHYKRS